MPLPASPCLSSPRAAAEERKCRIPVYAYDEDEPIAKQDAGLANSDYPVKIHDISFDGGAERVPAFLLLPPGEGPYPAAIYLHGQGGDRLEMLYTASWLAGRRAVASDGRVPVLAEPRDRAGARRRGPAEGANRTVQSVVELGAPSTSSSHCPRWTTKRSASSATAPGRGPARSSPASSPDQGVRLHVRRRGLGRRVHDARPAGAARRGAAAPRGHRRAEVHRAGEPVEALLPGGPEGLGRPEGRARDADQGGQRAEEGRLVRRRPRPRGPEGSA